MLRIVFKAIILIFTCIGVYLGSMGYALSPGDAWGGEGAQVSSANGVDYYSGTTTHPVPAALLPGGGAGCPDLTGVTYFYTTWYTSTSGDCGSQNLNGWLNCSNSDYAGDYWVTWSDSGCNLPYGPYYRQIHVLYQKKTSPPSASTYDYDGDGIMDAVDAALGVPGTDADQKWRVKYKYTNKTTGVTYTYYEGDKGGAFWSSSDGSAIPTNFSTDDYKIEMSVYAGTGGYKTLGELGFGSGTGVGSGSGYVGTVSGGSSVSSTSPGKGDGGYSGSASTTGSTSDWTTMYDYLRGIQQNTKSTVDNLVEVEKDLETIKANQSLTGTGTGTSTTEQIDTRPNIDNVKTSVDSVKSVLDEIKTQLGNETYGEISDPDTSSIQDNTDLSDEENETKYQAEVESLTTFLDDLIYQENPITSIIAGSGVDDTGGSSSVSVSAGGFNFVLDFSGCESQLDLIGIFFVSFCGLAGIVEFLRG